MLDTRMRNSERASPHVGKNEQYILIIDCDLFQIAEHVFVSYDLGGHSSAPLYYRDVIKYEMFNISEVSRHLISKAPRALPQLGLACSVCSLNIQVSSVILTITILLLSPCR